MSFDNELNSLNTFLDDESDGSDESDDEAPQAPSAQQHQHPRSFSNLAHSNLPLPEAQQQFPSSSNSFELLPRLQPGKLPGPSSALVPTSQASETSNVPADFRAWMLDGFNTADAIKNEISKESGIPFAVEFQDPRINNGTFVLASLVSPTIDLRFANEFGKCCVSYLTETSGVNNGVVYTVFVSGSPMFLVVRLCFPQSFAPVTVMQPKPKLAKEQERRQVVMFDKKKPVFFDAKMKIRVMVQSNDLGGSNLVLVAMLAKRHLSSYHVVAIGQSPAVRVLNHSNSKKPSKTELMNDPKRPRIENAPFGSLLDARPNPATAQFPDKATSDLSLFNLLCTPVWVLDVLNMRIRWANSSALEMWRAESIEHLHQRNLPSELSEPLLQKLHGVLRQLVDGAKLVDRWTILPMGFRLSCLCACSLFLVPDGTPCMLVESSELDWRDM